jgi:hypothetical protein
MRSEALRGAEDAGCSPDSATEGEIMPYSMKCPDCGRMICYDVPDEMVCECGWSEQDDYEDAVRRHCEGAGEDYGRLLKELGDVETIDSFLWALEKDD